MAVKTPSQGNCRPAHPDLPRPANHHPTSRATSVPHRLGDLGPLKRRTVHRGHHPRPHLPHHRADLSLTAPARQRVHLLLARHRTLPHRLKPVPEHPRRRIPTLHRGLPELTKLPNGLRQPIRRGPKLLAKCTFEVIRVRRFPVGPAKMSLCKSPTTPQNRPIHPTTSTGAVPVVPGLDVTLTPAAVRSSLAFDAHADRTTPAVIAATHPRHTDVKLIALPAHRQFRYNANNCVAIFSAQARSWAAGS